MKKHLLTFLFLFFLISILIQCTCKEPEIPSDKIRIVLVNPDAGDLSSFIALAEHRIIDIPNLEFHAVFYSKCKKRYEESKQLINDSDISFVRLHQIEGDLNQSNLYRKNSCTEDFYQIFKNSEGILFLGGLDLPPAVYAQKTNLLTDIKTPNRHYFELSFLFHLLGGSQDTSYKAFMDKKPDYVIYGFCLGMQTMNVAAGGAMFQDIPSDVYGLHYVEDVLELNPDLTHRNYRSDINLSEELSSRSYHRILFSEGGFFIDKLKFASSDYFVVRSSHHQAVKTLGKDFQIAATSMDSKIIEAVTHQKYANVIGVQFHPEAFSLYDKNGRKYRFNPTDSLLISQYELLKQTKSLNFHLTYWKYFNSLFTN